MPTASDYHIDSEGRWKLRPDGVHSGVSLKPVEQALVSQGSKELKLFWANDIGSEPDIGEHDPCLWGDFLISESIHLLSGEAGVGKTTFGYNLSIKASKGGDFLGIEFNRPLRVLYIDLETPYLLWCRKIRIISDSNPPDNLAFIFSISLEDDIRQLIAEVDAHHFDLVIVDTINEAFQTVDEDDNAEANRQMALTRQLTRETGAAVVLVHHVGKSEPGKKVYRGRGASARPASADVVLNLEGVSDQVIKLEMVKNRWLGGISKLFLRKMGEDVFEPAELSGEESVSLRTKAQGFILNLLERTGKAMSAGELKAYGKAHAFSSATIERALSGLVMDGRVHRAKRGLYSLPEGSKPSVTSTPREKVMDGSAEGGYVTEKI